MADSMVYQTLAPERRQALQTQPNGFKWLLFFMLQASIILLLLEAQRASQPVPLLIRAGYMPETGCTCGECAYCKSERERECDYGR